MPTRSRRAAAVGLALLLTAAGCGGDEAGPDDAPTAASSPTAADPSPASASPEGEQDDAVSPSASATATAEESSAPDEPTASSAPSPDPAALRVELAEAGDGFEGPVHAFAHEGRTLVVEQVGRITDLDSGEVWLDLTDRVTSGGERGLLGADVHPDGRHLAVHFSGSDGQTVLATYALVDGSPDVDSQTVVLTVPQPASNHNGGSALFGPDGRLWLALGDGGAAGDRFGNGQDPSTLLGTLLRLDLDDPAVARVPSDNPFASGDGGAPEVAVYGLRNPYRVAFGDGQVYIADVGQDAREEVTALSLDQLGANLGWPAVEGDVCFQDGCDLGAFEPADVAYAHDTGACSVIGGLVYAGEALPALTGHFLYGDLCSGILRTVQADAGDVVAELDLTDQVGSVGGLIGIGEDAHGEPLLGFQDGRLLRLVPAGG